MQITIDIRNLKFPEKINELRWNSFAVLCAGSRFPVSSNDDLHLPSRQVMFDFTDIQRCFADLLCSLNTLNSNPKYLERVLFQPTIGQIPISKIISSLYYGNHV